MNSLEKIVGILIACILLFIFPMYNMSVKSDKVIQTYVDDETAKLVETIRNTGTLTTEMYEIYRKKLTSTNNLYLIDIVHLHAVYYPIFDDSGVSTGEAKLIYQNTYTNDILEQVFSSEGVYKFSEGDYVSIKVKSTNRNVTDIIEETIFNRSLSNGRVDVLQGGRIRDEN